MFVFSIKKPLVISRVSAKQLVSNTSLNFDFKNNLKIIALSFNFYDIAVLFYLTSTLLLHVSYFFMICSFICFLPCIIWTVSYLNLFSALILFYFLLSFIPLLTLSLKLLLPSASMKPCISWVLVFPLALSSQLWCLAPLSSHSSNVVLFRASFFFPTHFPQAISSHSLDLIVITTLTIPNL